MSEVDLSARFAEIEHSLSEGMPADRLSLLDHIAGLDPLRSGRGFTDFGGEIVAALTEAAAISDEAGRRDFSRALIARLASTTLSRAETLALTPRILGRTKAWLVTLADFLAGADQGPFYWYPGDWFCKDYRFVMMLTVPCGARVVDLHDGLSFKTALKLGMRNPLAGLRAWARPWFRVHTETRNLDEFNEEGWRDCCREVARLLELHPEIAGMVATSWFYDPAVSAISPHLAYLRRFPMEHGANLVRHRTTRFDVRSATTTSPTRRALYESGKYAPVAHSIVWARREMINWAMQAD